MDEVVEIAPGRFKRLNPGEQPPPGMVRKFMNFAGAVFSHAAYGWQEALPELKQARLTACEGCAEFDAPRRKCRHWKCGCNMDVKAGWLEQACPLGKWPLTVNMGALGVGDALLGLWAVNGLRRDSPSREVWYGVSDVATPWVELFGGYDRLFHHDYDACRDLPPNSPHLQINKGWDAEWRAGHPKPRWERYCQNVGASGPVRPPLKDPAALMAAGERWLGCVALAPWARHNDRDWRLPHWLALERELIAAGRRTVVLDGGHAPAGDVALFAGEKVIGRPALEAAGVLMNAAVTVCNESGIAHVCGCLGVPAVCVSRPYGRQVLGLYESVRLVTHDRLDGVTPGAVLSAVTAHARRGALLDPAVLLHLARLGAGDRDRRHTFAAFLTAIQRHKSPLVLEAGCCRIADNYNGDGLSTVLLGRFLAAHGGRLFSCDVDPKATALARELCEGLPVTVFREDADVAFADSTAPAAGVYLDACDDPQETLAQAQAVLPRLAPNAAVLIDDTARDGHAWAGKGSLAVPELLAAGFTVAAEGCQVLLAKGAS
jgi:hypothetical protein